MRLMTSKLVPKLLKVTKWSLFIFSPEPPMDVRLRVNSLLRKCKELGLSEVVDQLLRDPYVTNICGNTPDIRDNIRWAGSLIWGFLKHKFLFCRTLLYCFYSNRLPRDGWSIEPDTRLFLLFSKFKVLDFAIYNNVSALGRAWVWGQSRTSTAGK